ncbi:hypothetical protein [Thermoactinomyces sp. DSM 45892]|uniref:hypothetical protein n=1 Tax=Thermoactinomyces sp. DSM 45892 TaxID=1882753 RepID=UPI0008993DFA|nr:hypothetical protein [Thermoactinomyces sp. DSM 45892]SDZ01389.1 hypothetical protein SAMN05444416_111126 [Thermoactinomyces sp. DSM 45892]
MEGTLEQMLRGRSFKQYFKDALGFKDSTLSDGFVYVDSALGSDMDRPPAKRLPSLSNISTLMLVYGEQGAHSLRQ